MSQKFARLLGNQVLVRHFLDEVLEHDFSDLKRIESKIISGEKGLSDFNIHDQTLHTKNYRVRDFIEDKDRWKLRERIVSELISLPRPEDDDTIKLGEGGALPTTGLHSRKKAFIIIGLPASGKSTISNNCADKNHAIIIDADYAKRKLPEYNEYPWGASIVHEESSQVVTGFEPNPKKMASVYEHALEKGWNMVLPKIGQKPDGILKLSRTLKRMGYEVHLTLVSLLKRDSTVRAVYRFAKTERYVPLGLIFDGYGNDPSLSYYLLKSRYKDDFNSFGAVSTDVPIGVDPFSIDVDGMGNPALDYVFKENILH